MSAPQPQVSVSAGYGFQPPTHLPLFSGWLPFPDHAHCALSLGVGTYPEGITAKCLVNLPQLRTIRNIFEILEENPKIIAPREFIGPIAPHRVN